MFGPPTPATTGDKRRKSRRLRRHALPKQRGCYQPWWQAADRQSQAEAQPLRRREAFLTACALARRKVQMRRSTLVRRREAKHGGPEPEFSSNYEVGRNSYVRGIIANDSIVYYRAPDARRPWKTQAERRAARAAERALAQQERAQRQRLLANRAAWHTPSLGHSVADDIGSFLDGNSQAAAAATPATPATGSPRRPQLGMLTSSLSLQEGAEGSYLQGYLRSPSHKQAEQKKQAE